MTTHRGGPHSACPHPTSTSMPSMTEQTTGEPQAGQDCNDIVMAEIVHPGGRWLPWVVAAVLVCRVSFRRYYHTAANSPFARVGMGIRVAGRLLHWSGESDRGLGIAGTGEYRAAGLLVSAIDNGDVVRLDIGRGDSPPVTDQLRFHDAVGRDPIDYRASGRRGDFADSAVDRRKVFRWRLTRRPDDTAASLQEDRQFQIQHLLVATVLVALALSPLRRMLPPERSIPYTLIANCLCSCRP